MTDVDPDAIAALKKKGEAEAEEKSKPREESKNWNKGRQEGDMLAGLLVRGDKVQIKGREDEGPTYLMEIRDHETGELFTVWCGNYQLKQAVIDKAPAKDKLVVVQYHGRQPLDGGKTMNVYTVEPEEEDFEYWRGIDEAFWKKQQDKPAAPVARTQFGPDEAPF